MIYKTFFGKHIDLSKLISISDAEWFHNYRGLSLYTIKFEMIFQLMDVPIVYERAVNEETELVYEKINEDYYYNLLMSNGTKEKFHTSDIHCISEEIGRKSQAVVTLQEQVDEIIKTWKNFKKEKQDGKS